MNMTNTNRLLARKSLGIALAAVFGLSATAPLKAEIKLVFGTYTSDKPTETVRKLKPVLRYLEAELSRQLADKVIISTQIARDYDKGIAQLTTGKVDFARLGPASYVIARERSNKINILAMEAVKGAKTFKGIICVREDSDIQSMSQLKGRSFAFGNKLSTIGRYLAQGQLLKAGIKGSDLKRYAYLGRHDRVGTAVGAGKFEAGALKFSTFRKLRKNKVPIRQLLSFQNVTKPWVARGGLPANIAQALEMALIGIKDKKVLKAIRKSGFLTGKDSDYDVIRTAMQKSRQFDS